MILKNEIAKLIGDSINKAVKDGRFDISNPQIKVEYPKEERFGDYSTPVALEAAKLARKSPIVIGEILKEYISQSEIIEKVEVVKPGFINMFISFNYLFANLMNIRLQGDTYGTNKKANPKKVNIEFVSANPTGPLNIVSARAAAIGDTLANLLAADGDIVHREFYINDYGNQVNLLGESVLCRYRELHGEKADIPEEGYHGDYVKDIAKHIMDNYQKELEELTSDEDIIKFMAEKAAGYNVAAQRMDLQKFHISFDTWFSEKTLHESGMVMKTLEYLKNEDIIYKDNGKTVFRSTDHGDDKDRVLLREDGRPTYFLADIAYHKSKIDRGYNRIIDIWGPDHHGYIPRLKGAMKFFGFDNEFQILLAQQVNLVMEGEIVKMSKRLGNFSTMRELIDEIGVDVTRYFFIMRSLDSHLDFDLSLAKRQSSENPVFYLQYAHARICSLFREASSRGMDYQPENSGIEYLRNPEAIVLLKYLVRFPEEVHDAACTFEPHRISNYLLRLAQAYHKFYTEHRILSEDSKRTSTYLMLCDAVRIVLKNGLRLIGVSSPERM